MVEKTPKRRGRTENYDKQRVSGLDVLITQVLTLRIFRSFNNKKGGDAYG